MSTQPQLFTEVPLGESFELEYGAPMPERERTGLGYPVFGSNGTVGRHSKFLIPGPGIVVGRKGSVGEVSWSSESFWPIDTAYYVVPKAETNLRWLYWLLTRTDLKRLDAATGVPGLNRNDVYSLKAHRPPPPEQSRIAAVLDTVDEAIAKTEAVIGKLRQVRAGLLHDLLTRGLDEHGHLRDPLAHPEQFQDSPLGRIPKKWEVRSCQSLCREIVVGIVVKPAQYYVEQGVPVLRSANVREDGIELGELVFISEESNRQLGKSMLRRNDVVTVRTGYPGTTCVVPSHLDGANCVDLIISRPGAEVVPHFLALWVNSPFGKDQVLRVQGGLAQQHFNVGEMKALLVAKPQPDEQQEIVQRLDSLTAEIAVVTSEQTKLALLKSGLMADLLTGRVRVPERAEVRR